MTNAEIRKQLNDYLKNYGVKLRFIAERSGINYEHLSKFKNGHIEMRKSTLERIHRVMGGDVG